MTVAALIKALQKQDPKAHVILSSDPEGNHHSPLYSATPAVWDGEDLRLREWTDDDVCLDPDTWKAMKRDPKMRAILLSPES
jgi:hypothetical protein